MRIGFAIPSLSGGGAERIMATVAAGLARSGHETHLITFDAAAERQVQLPDGVGLIELRSGSARRAISPLIKAVRDQRIEVVCSTLKHVSVMVEVARFLSRNAFAHVVRVANTYSEELRRMTALQRTLYSVPLSWAHRRANGVICVSRGISDDLAEMLPGRPLRSAVIANPVFDPGILKLAESAVEPRNDVMAKMPELVAAGRLVDQKGFDVLLRAVSLIPEDKRPCVTILGDGPLRGQLLGLAQELGIADRIHLRGYVDNPYPYLARASLFVLSSRFEGLPNVLIQALCLGTRVVATDCRSGPREILAGSTDGCLVPVDEPNGLAAGIIAQLDPSLPAVDAERYRKIYDAGMRVADYESFLRETRR